VRRWISSNVTTEEMRKTGERIYNIERLFNQKAGMKPEDDTLPQRLLEEPITNKTSEVCLTALIKCYLNIINYVDGKMLFLLKQL
jgi:aldehyde:ferredoxin oxidoreductase